MQDSYVVFIHGLTESEALDSAPEKIAKAARMAINRTADRSRTAISRAIRAQLNFSARYLDGKLKVDKRASNSDLEAVIKGTDRPTMLARFSRDGSASSRKAKQVRVEIKPGVAKFIRNAFIIKLRNNNLGLAWRSKSGSAPSGAWKPKEISPNLWLLYGPSVDQAFRQALAKQGAISDAEEFLADEFNRLLDLGL